MACSSLGYAAAYAGLAPCEHAWLEPGETVPRTVESGNRLWDFDVVFVSCGWELEIPVLVAALEASGISPFAADRPVNQPLVVGGGPLTLSNPDLLAVMCDAVFVGEADNAFAQIDAAFDAASSRNDALKRLGAIEGIWVPSSGAVAPSPVTVRLPATPLHSVFTDCENEFSGAFIVEVGRGCPRGCAFCVAFGGRRATFFDADLILKTIPDGVVRAGLLGAAVSDHPKLKYIISSLLDRGTGVTLGSLRADRIDEELVSMLARGGLRSMTIAADGPSERLRLSISKGITEEHIRNAARVANTCGIDRLRVYVMVGLPGETDADISEFAKLMVELSAHVKVVVSVSPFVPKRFTPLEGAPFAGIGTVRRRISDLKKQVGTRIEVRAGSVKQAELEHRLSNVRLADAKALVADVMKTNRGG